MTVREEIQVLKLEWERACEESITREKQRRESIRKKHEEEIRARISSKEYREALEWLKKMKEGEQR